MELFTWWDDADWIVRGVFIVLIAVSLISWTIMLYKGWQLMVAYKGERAFARGTVPRKGLPSAYVMAGVAGVSGDERETLAQALLRESRLDMESGLTPLATIGNTAPFIGLFGTVWGIMHALQALGGAEAPSMDLVAGPVAEALVATAAGLFAAIPAVVGYNLLLRQLRRVFGAAETNALRIIATQTAEDK